MARTLAITSIASACSAWLALQVLSPSWMRLSAHGWPPVFEAGLASSARSFAHSSVKPVLRMPPGYSVVSVLLSTDSGAIADRLGGRVWATNSWLIPP